MLKRSVSVRRVVIAAVAFMATLDLVWTARAQGPSTRNIALKADQVSRGEDGRLVIAISASGDLRGALTLTITGTSSTGSITGGEWVLVNTYIEDVLGEGHTEDDGHDEEYPGHHAGERLIQLGSLSGAITGGTLTLDSSGNASSVTFVQLGIALGSLSFDGVHEGTGSLALSGLEDVARSSGSAAFTF